MKFKTIIKPLFIILVTLGITSCNEKTESKVEIVKNANLIPIGIFNFDNKQQLAQYNKLNLDKTHPNLVNPKISKSDYNSVMKSWTDLHQRIGTYLSENRFNWETEDNSINIIHKIYFKPNGEIENYFFNVLTKNVTKEKKERFANLISDFAMDNRIDYKKEGNFAQCGKTKYLNK
ncbi:MAG: hypothetical protein V7719_04595 [Psychroserpens sp.]|uniref:hypothetical protein n=1 Tax=Psychroserpens sp. TaxID=2020870 RepID=UPI0030027E83